MNMAGRRGAESQRERGPPRRFRSVSPSSPRSLNRNEHGKNGAEKGENKTEKGTFKVCPGSNGNSNQVCGKPIDMDSPSCIKCEICVKWYHMQCDGLNAKRGKAIKDMGGIWICQECTKALPDIRKMLEEGNSNVSAQVVGEIGKLGMQIKALEEKLKDGWEAVNKESMSKCDKVEEKVGKALDKVEKSLQQNTEMVASIKNSTGPTEATQASYADIVKQVVGEKMEKVKNQARPPILEQKMVQECFDKENRKCNVVLSNFAEPRGTGAGNRAATDKQAVYEMIHKLHLEVDIGKVVRLGAIPNDGRPRLLLMGTQSEEVKWDLIRAAKGLRDLDEYKDVYVNPDMTRLEREAQGKLRAEMRERRNNGEEVYISKGKIWTRRGQHQGSRHRQDAPAYIPREAHPAPVPQEQVHGQADDSAEVAVERRQVAPQVEQANQPAEEQEEQLEEAEEVQEQVEGAEAITAGTQQNQMGTNQVQD